MKNEIYIRYVTGSDEKRGEGWMEGGGGLEGGRDGRRGVGREGGFCLHN